MILRAFCTAAPEVQKAVVESLSSIDVNESSRMNLEALENAQEVLETHSWATSHTVDSLQCLPFGPYAESLAPNCGADDATAGAVPGDARGGLNPNPKPAREYDIIRAECAKKMELAERNRARARRAASRRRAGDDPSWRMSERANAREESERAAEARARAAPTPTSRAGSRPRRGSSGRMSGGRAAATSRCRRWSAAARARATSTRAPCAAAG